jgi:hypothetical protein
MDFRTMAARLSPITEILTPTGCSRNRIICVDERSVTVVSERTERERVISFRSILRPSTTKHGCIVRSFRQVLGLQ